MSNRLISQLSELKMKEKHLKRFLDVTYYDKQKRKKFFEEIQKTKKDIKNIKFQIRLEREMRKDEKSR